ncbi:hypothetical protein QJS10_CPB15g01098 [Acorus calamus]|uniref:FHA domain-containing protein n=1 Tax=Acorus calamus TaxID=4465 RepID=A0AAV9DCM2_ACOCL|nr:hypothetical protein QJS10_CPB15g01098 [Acorus calamus]
MKVLMGPPPPPQNPNPNTDNVSVPAGNANTDGEAETQPNKIESESDVKAPENPNPNSMASKTMKVLMGPPPPLQNPNPPDPDDVAVPAEGASTNGEAEARPIEIGAEADVKAPETANPNPSSKAVETSSATAHGVPYNIPPWSEPPQHPFLLEVLKDGAIIEQFDLSEKGAYMFGRVDLCDFVLEHPTISRFHAVLQFKNTGEAFLYDLGSTHGTFINKNQVKKKFYSKLHVGDVVRFGHSSRLYIFQGPSELMPPEGDLKRLRNVKIREEMQDREASLSRARVEASLADGISWGMAEDAIEDTAEDDVDEVTWQTYKGPLTEKQEKTRNKIIKRMEKMANMRKEIDAIRVKDISQGGLTQGQQTQIARNEQRMTQIMEELENLEETLNESIQEALGARSGRVNYGKKKGLTEDEDDAPSDEDDFYDRTKKKPVIKKSVEEQQIETVDSLLDKKEAIIKEIEKKTNLLAEEKTKMMSKLEPEASTEGSDALDAYMSGLSSQLVVDATTQIQKDMSDLKVELDRIQYLLKIADPTGDALKRRDAKGQTSQSIQLKIPNPVISKMPPPKQKKSTSIVKPAVDASHKEEISSTVKQTSEPSEDDKKAPMENDSEKTKFVLPKPQWLGDVKDVKKEENEHQEVPLEMDEDREFVSYKDRKTLMQVDDQPVESSIEAAPGGLIKRKRKQKETEATTDSTQEVSTSSSADAETAAADAVALLLKHTRGYSELDEVGDEGKDIQGEGSSRKTKRVLGSERPAFLERDPEYESWVPPEGQSGDGRTALNERYGY